MKIDRSNCEAFLIYVASQIIHADVTSVAELLEKHDLMRLLYQALTVWGCHVACTQRTVTDVARLLDMSHDDMVGDFVHHVMGKGSRAKKPYPRLTRILEVLHTDGARAIAPYLVRVARNRVLDLERARERQRKRSGEIFGFLSDDTFGAIDPGESRDTRLMDMDERLIRHEAIADFASRIGQDFVSDLVILADAMGIQRRTAANYFFTGKQVTLACIVIASFNHSMGGDFTSDFALLLREARAYTLPEHLRCDHAALLRHLYRKSSPAARQRMARRTGALAA